MRPGDVCRLLGLPSGRTRLGLVLSGRRLFRAGRVWVCAVVPHAQPEDFAAVRRISYQDGEVVRVAVAVPDLLTTLPVSGLSAPVGHVRDLRPILTLVHDILDDR